MKLSVIIVHYNTSEDLGRCLDSLAAHGPTCPFAVVVVDNASRDPGLPAVRGRYSDARWLMNDENVGYARGVNQGMAAVPADYYLILNPDIVVHPGAIDRLLAYADAHPRAGIVGPQLLNEDGTIQDSCRRFYTFGTLLLRRTPLGRLFPRARSVERHLMRDFDHRSDRPVDWVLGGCLLARRAAVERAGALDERFFLYFEDVDWCFRMGRAGWDVLYAPVAQFTHRHRRASAQGALHRSFWFHLGSLISFYEKWGMVVYLLKKWRRPLELALLWAIDMLALGGALAGAWLLRAWLNPLFPERLFPLGEYRPLWLFAALLVTIAFLFMGRYRGAAGRRSSRAGARAQQVAVVGLLLLASTYLSHQQVYSRAVLLLFVPLFALAIALGEAIFRFLRRRMERGYLSLERILLVGEPEPVARWLLASGDRRELGLDPVGYVADPRPGAPAPPALAGGAVPWLGPRAAIPAVVERFQLSQVVFWGWPARDPGERALLERLRRRRIRLRWRVDEAWLLGAGARAEEFGGLPSAVLEPAAGVALIGAARRVADVLAGALLLAVTALPWLLAGRRRTRPWPAGAEPALAAPDDPAGGPPATRPAPPVGVACRRDGRTRSLLFQRPLAAALLKGRVALWGPPVGALSAAEIATGIRPGLTGPWAASGYLSASSWVIMTAAGRLLLCDPGGLDVGRPGEAPRAMPEGGRGPQREVSE